MKLNEMSLSELIRLKSTWYNQAQSDGTIADLYNIGRTLGEKVNHNYGPKYKLVDGNIELYVDDYGGYMTVKKDGKLVCSTHNEKLFIKDSLNDFIIRHISDVKKIQKKEATAEEEKERLELIKTLTT